MIDDLYQYSSGHQWASCRHLSVVRYKFFGNGFPNRIRRGRAGTVRCKTGKYGKVDSYPTTLQQPSMMLSYMHHALGLIKKNSSAP